MSKTTIPTAGLADDAVDLTSKVTGALPIANGGTALTTGFVNGGGLTVADQWYLSSSLDTSSSFVTANLSQNTGNGRGSLGTAMSQSSGIFTFPSTGFYLVIFNACIESSSDDSRYISCEIFVTTDNSSYNAIQRNSGNITNQSDARDTNAPVFAIVDVTDTSNVKVKFNFAAESTVGLAGASGVQRKTTFSFLRLGDT
jgi:hypothetical protein|tara:strand:+ start:66 stop:662 length:597 start_codon:yes stop_codon:yes gene_type:complete